MDRKKKNLIICPKCKKLGTLRRKEKGKNRLICYHYDKKKYQKNESPDSPCYLGTLDQELKTAIYNSWTKKKVEAVKRKHEGESPKKIQDEIRNATLEHQKDLERIGEILDNFEITEEKYEDFNFEKEETRILLNDIVQEIATMTNEFRKSNQYMEKPRRLIWDIHCPSCLTKYIIASHFMGIKQSDIKLDVIKAGRKRSYKPDINY